MGILTIRKTNQQMTAAANVGKNSKHHNHLISLFVNIAFYQLSLMLHATKR